MSRKFVVLFVWTVVSSVIALNSGFAQTPPTSPTPQSPTTTQIMTDGISIAISPMEGIVNRTPNELKGGSDVATFVTETDVRCASTPDRIIPAGKYTLRLQFVDNGWI